MTGDVKTALPGLADDFFERDLVADKKHIAVARANQNEGKIILIYDAESMKLCKTLDVSSTISFYSDPRFRKNELQIIRMTMTADYLTANFVSDTIDKRWTRYSTVVWKREKNFSEQPFIVSGWRTITPGMITHR